MTDVAAMDRVASASAPAHVPPHLVVDFDVYDPTRQADAFHAAYRDFQRATTHPLVWTHHHGGHWVVVGGKDVFEAHADHERFTSRVISVPPPRRQDFAGALTLDPPDHKPFRAFLNTGLSPKIVKPREPAIRALAASLIEGFIARGRCEFIQDFADILPLTVFLNLVDVPLEDRAKLAAWTELAARSVDPTERARGTRNTRDYIGPMIRERRANPGSDLLSHIANAEIDGRPISEEEALGAATHVMGVGLDTVASLLGFVMLFLAQNPDHRRALVENPQLIPAASMELIRRFPIVVMAREVHADTTYLGVDIRKGDMIAIPSAFYNLDDAEYPDPLAVDWDRRVTSVCTFGNGAHRCPGAVLGRMELTIVLQEWLKRIPEFSVAPGVEVTVQGGIVAKVDALPLVWTAQS